MRKNLVSFLLRLAIVTFLLTGGQLTRSLGHDLPNYFPYHELGADCLGVRLPEARPPLAVPAVQPPAPQPKRIARQPELPLTNPSSLLALGLAYSDVAYQAFCQAAWLPQAKQQIASLATWLQQLDSDALVPLNSPKAKAAHPTQLFAALPDEARAPVPAAAPATAGRPAFSATVANLADSFDRIERVEAKRNYVEDYLPYDLCISDWRFGQYSYRGLSRIAHLQQPRAEVTEVAQLQVHPAPALTPAKPTAEFLAHGEILSDALGRLNDWQCKLYSEFCGFDSAYELGVFSANAQKRITHHAASHAIELAAAWTPTSRQPFYSEPIYVVYELDGKLFLIAAEQAQQWAALRPALPPTAAKEVQVAQSLRQTVLSLASQQLASIGNQLLNVASTLESFSGNKVAGGKQQNVR